MQLLCGIIKGQQNAVLTLKTSENIVAILKLYSLLFSNWCKLFLHETMKIKLYQLCWIIFSDKKVYQCPQ